VERTSLEVRELGAADALVMTPAGVVADLHLGRAVGAALRHRLWNGAGHAGRGAGGGPHGPGRRRASWPPSGSRT
jgi:hypothetical protein